MTKAIIITKEYLLKLKSDNFDTFSDDFMNNESDSIYGFIDNSFAFEKTTKFLIRVSYTEKVVCNQLFEFGCDDITYYEEVFSSSLQTFNYFILYINNLRCDITKKTLRSKIKEYFKRREISLNIVDTILVMEITIDDDASIYVKNLFNYKTELNLKHIMYDWKKEDCSICLEKTIFKVDENSCGHRFHSDCISKYAITKQNENLTNFIIPCPLCRSALNIKHEVRFIKFNRIIIAAVILKSKMNKFKKLCDNLNLQVADDINNYDYYNSELINDERSLVATIYSFKINKKIFVRLDGLRVIGDYWVIRNLKPKLLLLNK